MIVPLIEMSLMSITNSMFVIKCEKNDLTHKLCK